MIEAVPEEALGPSAMRLDPQALCAAIMQPLANPVRPAERDGDQGEELIDPFKPVEVGRFEIEASALATGQNFETRGEVILGARTVRVGYG